MNLLGVLHQPDGGYSQHPQPHRQALLAERQAEIIHHSASDLYRLRLPEDADTLRVIEWYAAQPEVEFAEPNFRVRKMKKP